MTRERYGEIPEGGRALHGEPSRKSCWAMDTHAGSSRHPCASPCNGQANGEMPTARTTRQWARRGVLRSTPSRDRPPQSENPAATLTPGHRWGKPPVLEQALTGLVQNGHARLLVIQSAGTDVLDTQIETLRTEMDRCAMELDADGPPPKAAELPSTVEGEIAPGHPEVLRMCIRAKTLLDMILGVGQGGAEW